MYIVEYIHLIIYINKLCVYIYISRYICVYLQLIFIMIAVHNFLIKSIFYVYVYM